MQNSKLIRGIAIGSSVLAIIFLVITGILISQRGQPRRIVVAPTATSTATPTATPTLTPTLVPTATATMITNLPPPTATPRPFVNGSEEYLIDAQTGRVLYNVNSHARLPMASTTKIMTAILAIENADLTQVVPITQEELDEVPDGASVAQLRAGDKIRLSDLLYGLMLPSGCDAAIVIAHAVAGDTANFVTMMNAKAQSLQLNDTHYTNPHGALVDDQHYSSAADLVTLAAYSMKNSTFAGIVSQQSYELSATVNHHDYPWTNTNSLLKRYQGADGIKTGSSDGAGYCLVFSATINGRRLIGAELHAPNFDILYGDAANMLNLGFAS